VSRRVLRGFPLDGIYDHADLIIVAVLVLQGPFYQVPDWLYFRRDHAERAERAHKTVRAWCANLDPHRSDALRNPVIRLYAEYVWGFVTAIQRAPLTPAEKRECYRHLTGWLTNRAKVTRGRYVPEAPAAAGVLISSLDANVPGREGKLL
jgi:hypothetical protein